MRLGSDKVSRCDRRVLPRTSATVCGVGVFAGGRRRVTPRRLVCCLDFNFLHWSRQFAVGRVAKSENSGTSRTILFRRPGSGAQRLDYAGLVRSLGRIDWSRVRSGHDDPARGVRRPVRSPNVCAPTLSEARCRRPSTRDAEGRRASLRFTHSEPRESRGKAITLTIVEILQTTKR